MEKYKKSKMSIAYVDESGFAHDIARIHGYSMRRRRCYSSHDWNARGRKNVTAALSGVSLIGCGIVESTVDAAVFNTWIEKILIT